MRIESWSRKGSVIFACGIDLRIVEMEHGQVTALTPVSDGNHSKSWNDKLVNRRIQLLAKRASDLTYS